MQSDTQQVENIGRYAALLALLGGIALLVTTLFLGRFRPEGAAAAAAAAATATVQTALRESDDHQTPVAGEPRSKGSDRIVVFRKRAQAVEQLARGAPVADGDLIQIGYTAPSALYGVIFSVDGWGMVTLHHPARQDGATGLEPFGRQLLPYAFQLDNAPAFERILLVTGNRPIDVSAVLAAGRAMAAQHRTQPALPRGLRVSDELVLRKKRPRR